MAAGDNQLEFIIKAVDEASAAIATVKASTDALKGSVDSATQSLDKNATSTGKAQSANEGMATSVFKGVAAWGLLSEAAGAAKDFLEESVTAFLDAQKSIDLTKSTVISMGLSLDAAMPQLQAFGESMVKVGVDGEDAELSAAKLAKAAGNDVPKGLQLAKLAADLASSGYGDLASNTDTLTSVLAGRGTAAIKQYRLAISDTASTGEILNAIQQKVTQTTEQYADTIPGKIQVVKQGFTELQQAVGEGLVDALADAVKGGDAFGDGMSTMAEASSVLQVVAYELGESLVFVVQSIVAVGNFAAIAVNGFMALKDAATGHLTEAIAESKSVVDTFTGSLDALGKTAANILNPTAALANAQKNLATTFHATATDAGNAGDNVADMSSKSQASFVKLADKLADLKDAYGDLTTQATTDLATLRDSHLSDMATIQQSIAKTVQQIGALTTAYNQTQVSDTASVADAIVASQNKVADLKKQSAAAVTQDQYDQLQVQLAAEQKNLDSAAGFIATHADAIATAQARASETDLQRSIDDYNAKRALAQQEYNDNLAQLNQELADEQNKQAAEIALYNSRVAAVNVILTAANADYVQLSNDRLAQTTDEVNKEIALFQALASAISQVKSASSGAIATIPTPSLPTAHKAGGGTVMAGNSYVVGEKGQEVFTPSVTGRITPNGQGGGGAQITININGGYYLDDTVADKLGDKIMDKLRRKTRLGI